MDVTNITTNSETRQVTMNKEQLCWNGCNMAFIVSLHSNKPNFTYLLTYAVMQVWYFFANDLVSNSSVTIFNSYYCCICSHFNWYCCSNYCSSHFCLPVATAESCAVNSEKKIIINKMGVYWSVDIMEERSRWLTWFW